MIEFRTGYLDRAVDDLPGLIDQAVALLEAVDFDTVVGTGLSGSLVVPMLANRLNRSFVLVRKPDDGSHHGGLLVGNLGQRMVFVDDFICTGATKRRVVDTIRDVVTRRAEWDARAQRQPVLVGCYYYARDDGAGLGVYYPAGGAQ